MDGLPRLLDWQVKLLDEIVARCADGRWVILMPPQQGSGLPPGIHLIPKDTTDDR